MGQRWAQNRAKPVFYKKDILGGIELRDLKKVLICSAIALAAPGAALAEDAAATPLAAAAEPGSSPASVPVVGEVIVTAQKRAQSVNSVGMTVTTATGDALQARGVADVTDLGKVVTGLSGFVDVNESPVRLTIRCN